MVDGVLLKGGEDVSDDFFNVLKDGDRFVPVGSLEFRLFSEGFKDVHGEGDSVV